MRAVSFPTANARGNRALLGAVACGSVQQQLPGVGSSRMNLRDLLSHTWRNIARRHDCETSSAQLVLDELLGAYSQPDRKYHTIEHIGSLLRQVEEHGHALRDRDAVALA